ncbi:MAG: MBL fold metallo-hydrolase [Phycisphaeraceae bacterium]|nr:MBL fold metallo-hydrolase [Phycisphaeraceae bacterium]
MKQILPGLFTLADGCQVYAFVRGDAALVIDFGSGRIVPALRNIGVRKVDAVLITHPHREQVHGLSRWRGEALAVADAEPFLSQEGVRAFHRRPPESPVPTTCEPLARGLPRVRCCLSASQDYYWHEHRVRVVPTPGHTPAAVTYLIDWDAHRVALCGDAVCAGGTIRQPHHLEWSHYRTDGERAARQGLQELRSRAIDMILPSHGRPILEHPERDLDLAIRRLDKLALLRDCIAPNQRVDWFAVSVLTPHVCRVLPSLHQFGNNGYFLVSRTGEALVIDANPGDVEAIRWLMRHTGATRVGVAMATHYHGDHANGLAAMRDELGAAIWIPQGIATILRKPSAWALPFKPQPLHGHVERLLANASTAGWHEYRLCTWDFPGQTRYHHAFATTIDGRRVLFSGDNFFPTDRWGGSGGCCAANHSSPECYARSARKVLRWKPDLLCAGHRAIFPYCPGFFRRVLRWAGEYRSLLRELTATR